MKEKEDKTMRLWSTYKHYILFLYTTQNCLD